jgi:hypothetical protein
MHFLAEWINAPSRDRTYDPLIKSQLLYRLSYRGFFHFLFANHTCWQEGKTRKVFSLMVHFANIGKNPDFLELL